LQRFAYVPGCAAVTGAVVERVAGAGALFFDGTLFRDDELIAAGLTDKTGRRMGHAPMTGDGGSLDALSGVQVGRRIYLHLNNSNPALLGDSAERREVERRGFAVAYDGMVVVP
jgi:pyrroloquinoline quinone biosynthesis protein B